MGQKQMLKNPVQKYHEKLYNADHLWPTKLVDWALKGICWGITKFRRA